MHLEIPGGRNSLSNLQKHRTQAGLHAASYICSSVRPVFRDQIWSRTQAPPASLYLFQSLSSVMSVSNILAKGLGIAQGAK